MKIVLNVNEEKTYNDKIVNVIPQLAAKIYFYSDFFKGQATSARIARKFYEDVYNKVFRRVSLVGTRSREGYVIS